MAQVDEQPAASTTAAIQSIPQDLQKAFELLEQLSRDSKHDVNTQTTSPAPVEWANVGEQAKRIADALKTPELRVALGETSLIPSCGCLLSNSLQVDDSNPHVLDAHTELLRVAGNMCFDNDPNRSRALASEIPQSILRHLNNLLQSDASSASSATPRSLSLAELRFVRAAIGALLNSSLNYDPIRKLLLQTSSLSTLLSILDSRNAPERKIYPIYIVGSWMIKPEKEEDEEEWGERIELGTTIASWAMNILEDILVEDKSTFPPDSIEVLFSILSSLPSPSTPVPPYYLWEAEESSDFLDTDLELMALAANLLESTSIDLASVKHRIAFSQYSTTSASAENSSLLSLLFDFIETARLPDSWMSIAAQDRANVEKSFGMIKAAVVRAVVEAPNDDRVMIEFMKQPWIIEKLVQWLGQLERDDLLICASHMLAAIGRKDEHCVAFVQQYGIAVPLARIAQQKAVQQFQRDTNKPGGEVTQILFGVVSLLRHLSIPPPNKSVLGETGIITTVSMLLVPTLDFVSPLQNAVVGLLKHLTASNVFNSLRLLGAPSSASSSAPTTSPSPSSSAVTTTPSSGHGTSAPAVVVPSALDMMVALIQRTDDVRLRSEATRTLVNVVRSLFSTRVNTDPSKLAAASPISPTTNATTGTPGGGSNTPSSLFSGGGGGIDTEEALKRRGRPRVVRKDVVEALTEMVRLSEKYPMLINEAVVALTLVAGSGGQGATLVLEALTTPHSSPTTKSESENKSNPFSPTSPTSPSRAQSLAITPSGDPPIAATMLSNWISLLTSPTYIESNHTSSSTTNPISTIKSPVDAMSSLVKPQMIGNACALLITTLRGSEVAKVTQTKLDDLRMIVIGPLKGAQEGLDRFFDTTTLIPPKMMMMDGVWIALKKTIDRAVEVVAS